MKHLYKEPRTQNLINCANMMAGAIKEFDFASRMSAGAMVLLGASVFRARKIFNPLGFVKITAGNILFGFKKGR